MAMIRRIIAAVLFTCITGSACFLSAQSRPIPVVVTILPLSEFTEQVGKDRISVRVLIPPGANPHTYELTPSQIKDVIEARILVHTGSGIEFEHAWLDNLIAMNPSMHICDSGKGIERLPAHNGHHHHGHGHSHTGAYDPHIWLCPHNAMIMTENIKDALIIVDPDNAQFYKANALYYNESLLTLDSQIHELLSPYSHRTFIVYHPAWTYFARRYELQQISIETEGKEPSARSLARIIDRARRSNNRIIFISPHSDTRSARVVSEEIEGTLFVIDPLAKDYISNLLLVTQSIKEALE